MIMRSPRSGGAARAAALAAAVMCGASVAQTVNLKPGMYEVVSSSQVTLSPEMQNRLPPGYLARLQKPRTQQQCISDADVKQVGKKLSQERGNDPSCKMTDHTVSGNKVTFVMQWPARDHALRGHVLLQLVQGEHPLADRSWPDDHQHVGAADRGLHQVGGSRRLLVYRVHQVGAARLAYLGPDGPVVPERVAQLERIELLREADAVAHVQARRQVAAQHQ